jgi:AraC-like DNA-binding protein
MLTAITVKISDEYKQNIDDFSRDIVLANIALMMGYINRYFNRQFITRKHQNQEIVDKVSDLLEVYYTSDKATEMGLPSVQHIAEQLHLSPNYLSDLLRKETGSSTQDLIHEHIIERAKYKLLNSNDSVSRISISLGFEYPQYFSRMFKRRTGLAPQEFRKSEPPLLS